MKKMKKGVYFIGDPGYVLDEDKFYDITEPPADNPNDYDFWFSDFSGDGYWFHKTRYGDGGYNDVKGNTYGVDSGNIGVVYIKDIDIEKLRELKKLGKFVKFTKDFYCQYIDGVYFIGQTAKNRVLKNVVEGNEIRSSAPIIIVT